MSRDALTAVSDALRESCRVGCARPAYVIGLCAPCYQLHLLARVTGRPLGAHVDVQGLQWPSSVPCDDFPGCVE